MNVTLNNSYNRYSQNNNQCKPKPHFTANIPKTTVEVGKDVAKELSSNSSKFFEPFTKIYNKTSDFLCEHVAKPVLGSKWFGGFAEKVQNTGDYLFQNCLTTGSVITSGLYMQRTLTNDNMDKDRRNTLAVNQLLTLALSTAGAYLLDGYVKDWWENVSAKYVGHKVMDNNFHKDFKDVNKVIKDVNKLLKSNPDANPIALAQSSELKQKLSMTEEGFKYFTEVANKATKNDAEKVKSLKPVKLDKFIKNLVEENRIPQVSQKLNKQIKGIGLLRAMIIFGFVYRYLVPVAVTKPANKLCDMYLEHKKAKKQEKAQIA